MEQKADITQTGGPSKVLSLKTQELGWPGGTFVWAKWTHIPGKWERLSKKELEEHVMEMTVLMVNRRIMRTISVVTRRSISKVLY